MDSTHEVRKQPGSEHPQPVGESCPSSDQLAALLAGHLDASESAMLHRHVDRCDDCLELLAALATSSAETNPPSNSRLQHRALLAESAELTEGTALLGRFLIQRRLGRGATGVVYQADDVLHGHSVALKLLRQPGAQMLWRFKREFRLCRRFRHAQIVNVYDLFTDGRSWWFTMELVDGSDLLSWLADTAPDETASQLRQAFSQIAASLHALHQAGLVHRDVKSQNLRVTPSGRVVLIDLGLTTEIGDSSGDVVGTPVYMSPEQSVGGRASPASDWYSFGVLLRTALDRLVGNSRSVPKDLRELAQMLTQPEAVFRPSGHLIMERLDSLRPEQASENRISLDGPLYSALEKLETALRQSVCGTSVLVTLQGPRIDHLLSAFAQRASRMSPSVTYLEIAGVAHEHIPRATLDAIVDGLIGLLRTWPEEELRTVFHSSLAALCEVFPAFLQLAPLRAMAVASPRQQSTARATPQLVPLFSLLLENLAARGPLILVLGDTHSMDQESSKILEAALSGPEAPSLLLLLVGHIDQSPWGNGIWRSRCQTVHVDSMLSSSPTSQGMAAEPSLTLALAVADDESWTQTELRSLRQELLHAGLGTESIREGVLSSTLNRSHSSEVMDLIRPTFRFAEGLARRGLQVALASDAERDKALARAHRMLRPVATEQDPNTRAMSGLLLDSRTATLCLHGSDAERVLLGRPTSFYGRITERGSIAQHLRHLFSQPQAGCLVITGEPGLGKTRLCQECLQTDLLLPHQRFSAECGPMGPGETFGLIRQTLRGLGWLASPFHGESAALEPAERLRTRISRSLSAGDAERVAEFLCEVCMTQSVDSPRLRAARQDARLMQHQIRQAFFDFLRAECEREPVVWFIDNLHWVDAASMRLVRDALHELHNLPLLILATARPQIHQRFPWLLDDPQYRTVPLSALEGLACQQIVRDAFGNSLTESQATMLVERAGGNPLFLEELIRAASVGPSDACPDSVRLLLHGRLTQLQPTEIDCLGAAGVIGETFSRAQLASVLRGDPDTIPGRLEKLVAAEWIAQVPTDADGGDWFRFRHSLLRDVAYERLTEDRQRQSHLDFGRYLMAQDILEPFRVAEHLDLGGDRSRAAHYYGEAAERALQAGAHDVAEDLAQRGIECDVNGAEPRLQIIWLEAHGWRRDLARSQRYVAETLGRTPPGSDMWLRAQILRQLLALNAGQPDQLLLVQHEMASCVPTETAASAYGYAFGGSTFILMLSGQRALVDSSIHHLTEALAPFAESNPIVAAWIETCQSFWLGFCRDQPWVALQLAQSAVLKFVSVNDELNACTPKTFAAMHSWALGDLTAAERQLSELVEGNKSTGGFREMQPGLFALVLLEQGKFEQAHPIIQRYLHRTNTQDLAFREGWVRWALAEYHFLSGDLASAEQEARKAIEQLVPMFQQQLPVRALLAEILLRQGRVQDAIAKARETLDSYHRLSALGFRGARAERVLAEALWTGNRRSEAASILAVARERISANASRISDAEVRHKYLTSVTEHQRIESLFRLVCGEVATTS